MREVERPQLILDFDDTIVDTLDVVVEYLNKIYDTNYKATDVKKWDMSDCFPMMQEDIDAGIIIDPFESNYFWKRLSLKSNVLKALLTLQDYYDILIISKGSQKNLRQKYDFIRRELTDEGVELQFIPRALSQTKQIGCINSDMSVMIDDNVEYLLEADVAFPILFCSFTDVEWNRGWKGYQLYYWGDAMTQWLIDVSIDLQNGGKYNFCKKKAKRYLDEG